jgi:NADPH-dependent F420 reductase
MKLAIIGSGNVGGALGKLWAEKGHDVTFGSRDPSADSVKAAAAAAGGAAIANVAGAAAGAEVVVIAVPWAAVPATIEAAGDLSGKIILDATNPLEADLSGLAVDSSTSAAQEIAKLAGDAAVVKAFNSTGAGNYSNPGFGGQAASMLICGDDDDAKATVAQLTESLGFDVVDAGPLANASSLESLALLWIKLAYVVDFGPEIAWKLLRR